ncbi:MAG TPA: alpha-L-rhamnosidase C-terminal domain-containing protein [Vicinamibacterales bacterium]|nr:alpha-L-rhamnosidase C-terminal domain-containing protein [Vicinamibacterales bacterium]
MPLSPARLLTILVPSLLLAAQAAGAQPQASPELLARRWPASWIAARGTDPFGFGVYHFRKWLELPDQPRRFLVHVTADNRYQLWVNGVRVVWGPARGDLNHWRYETVDLAPHLRPGRNVVAAVVWNYGELAPEAQTTWRTGFLIQGDTAAEKAINSDATWKAAADPAYSPIPFTHAQLRGYYVVGPGERVDAARHHWGWETSDYDDSAWEAAQPAVPDGRASGAPRSMQDAPNRWLLVPRTIPLMEEAPERLAAVRQAVAAVVPAGFPAAPAAFTIPARTNARLLLDNARLTTAYPVLLYSGGAGATIRMGYAESLYLPRAIGGDKGNRHEVAGKEFVGNHDLVIADGGQHRRYSPLWWRTYRYIELTVETQGEALVIEDLHGIYTGYPFERRQRLEAGSPLVSQILDVGWRTARLCAHESYMDCPYYEQLQYAGDTRIQALVSLYGAGDARLMKNAIALLDDSRTAEGATMSRAPTRQQQYIPPFSLWWIGMVHDYFMYVDDQAFVREMLPGIRAVLQFFARHQEPGGPLGPLPWWNYVDWTTEWPSGVPPRDAAGASAPLDLQLLLAYDWAANLEEALGSRSMAAEHREAAGRLRATIRPRYWDAGRRLFADTPERRHYSQHSNVLAVLAGVLTGSEARDVVTRVLADETLTQCSYYFRHYLHSAVNLVGEGDRYLDLLGEWESMLSRGLTTFAERDERPGDPSRSDCHAWSSSPNFEIFRTVLGIDTAAPGFGRVQVRPFPGRLDRVAGSVPHPKGEISVSLERAGNGLRVEIGLPAGVPGEFWWRGARRELVPGPNAFTVEPAAGRSP